MTSAVYEDNDEFFAFWNFSIPFDSKLLLEHEMSKSWMTLYFKNARMKHPITEKSMTIVHNNLKKSYTLKKYVDFCSGTYATSMNEQTIMRKKELLLVFLDHSVQYCNS